MTWYITYYVHHNASQGGEVYEVEAESRVEIDSPAGLAAAIRYQPYDILEISTVAAREIKGSAKMDRDGVLHDDPLDSKLVALVDGITKMGLALCIDSGDHLEITPASQKQDRAA